MATFDLTDYLEDDAIVLEGIRSDTYPDGHAYSFASPSFETGLFLKNLMEFGQRAALGVVKPDDLQKLTLDDDEEFELFSRVMGDTLEQMRADGVSWERVQKIFTLLLRKWGQARPIETTLREAAGEAEARPNRAEKRAAVKAAKAPAKRPARKASARSSSRTAGSKSSRASSGTKARMAGPASTRSSATSGSKGAQTA